jgi:hypothetical protein
VLEHCLTADTSAEHDRDPDEYKRGLIATLVEVVRDRILVVSEHPTYTRFFTFREHIEAFALLGFSGCHEDIIRLVSVSARVKNTKRMRRVNQFFRRVDARAYLRRTVLCLRLTGAIHDMAAATMDKGKPPMLVRFAQGEGRKAIDSGPHLLRWADTGEMLACDHRVPWPLGTRPGSRLLDTALSDALRHSGERTPDLEPKLARRLAGEDAVVLDIETGEEKGRAGLPVLSQSVMFPTAGANRDALLTTMTAIFRVGPGGPKPIQT